MAYGWECGELCGVGRVAGVGMTLCLDKFAVCGKIPPRFEQKHKDLKMSFRANVESMSKIMDEMGITELELERQFLFGVYRKHIHLSKQVSVAAAAAMPCLPVAAESKQTTSEPAQNNVSGYALKSPMVGVAYLSPEPGAAPFTTVGAHIKAGDTVALVEAMKTFNPIKSDRDGIVKEILVSDGAAVEFDQPLIVIE